MLFPVYGHCPRETVAVFFELGTAQSFAMRPADFGYVPRNLYLGEPRYVEKVCPHSALLNGELPEEMRLTAKVDDELRFTMEQQDKRRAA